MYPFLKRAFDITASWLTRFGDKIKGVWAANDDRGDRNKDRQCSDRILHGDYGLTIEGLLGDPGPGLQLRG